jgi:hypothetical protein
MDSMSTSMHHFVEAKVAKAGEIIDRSRLAMPTPAEYTDFDEARGIIDECRSALAAAWDVDSVAACLRTATARLGELCGGPAEASVNAAIELLNRAIGGESM